MTTDFNRLHLLDTQPGLEGLDHDAYHAVIGPALKAAADAAAKRGDPTLHADLPAMLALVDISTHMAGLYSETYPERGVDPTQLASAPAGACVMVLQEAKMESDALAQCLSALQMAYQQLNDQDVLGDARPFIAHAWEHLVDDQREQAQACLTMAANTIIAAIENWEEQRNAS